MTTKGLEALGYEVNHTHIVGWWVDGCCGYNVAGYQNCEQDAVDAAWLEIQTVRIEGRHPIWLYEE